MTQKLQLGKSQLETSKTERNALNAKLERKTAELERVRQRLEALQKIRYKNMGFFLLKDLFYNMF